MSQVTIARWQTRGGAHWVELYRHSDGGYTYSGRDCGGCIGVLESDAKAIEVMTGKLWYMVPDNAVIGMKRVNLGASATPAHHATVLP